MKPINIYALTRTMNIENIQRLDRQMSGRKYYLAVKDWEIESLRMLMNHLQAYMPNAYELLFYYSFQIPKLGKEFDLLRISEDNVINIELKSNSVPEEQIRKQLEQNRYYLSTLGMNMRSYTYISGEDKLYRLTGGGNIIEVEWEILCEDILKQKNCYVDDIENMFKEERYIISPLAEPERFLQKEYFLTSQQKDISKRILKKIKSEGCCYQGFSGLPGTGKTLLLYDIAMSLSLKQKVAIIHCGVFSEELKHLDGRLKRIDFYDGRNEEIMPKLTGYSAVLVDEAHRLDSSVFKYISELTRQEKIPVVFCYDSEDAIEKDELGVNIVDNFRDIPGFEQYNLTNRIRANSELSAFIQCLMRGSNYNHRKDYPSVSAVLATDAKEAKRLIDYYKANDYTFIFDDNITDVGKDGDAVEVEIAGRQEYNKVVMLMDHCFYYEINKGLCSNCSRQFESPVRKLFHGLNRAKSSLAIVVLENENVFDVIMTVLQGQGKTRKN